MSLTTTERHQEICKLEWSLYETLHGQFADFESFQRVRVAELEKAEGTSGLTEQDREMYERYRAEWNSRAALRDEFGGNLEVFLAYRKAVDKGLVTDAEFTKGRR